MPLTGTMMLVSASRRLTEAGIPDAPRDARRILAHVLETPPGRLSLVLNDPVPLAAQELFIGLIERRAQREPVSHLIGHRAFYGRDFIVSSDVLDPRPETEILVEQALGTGFSRVADLGTGSGCILLTLLAERPAASGIGTDLSIPALSLARRNRAEHGLSARARFFPGSWCEAIPADAGLFDLIVSNPPYIAQGEMAGLSDEVRLHEPRMALTDEGDGLGAYRDIAAQAPAHLRPGGWLMVEIGPTQGAAVSQLFTAAGLQQVTLAQDLDGRDRVVRGQNPPL